MAGVTVAGEFKVIDNVAGSWLTSQPQMRPPRPPEEKKKKQRYYIRGRRISSNAVLKSDN